MQEMENRKLLYFRAPLARENIITSQNRNYDELD